MNSAEIKYSEDDDNDGWLSRAEDQLATCTRNTDYMYSKLCVCCFGLSWETKFRISCLSHKSPEMGSDHELLWLKPKVASDRIGSVFYTKRPIPRATQDIRLYEWGLVISGRENGSLDTMYDGIRRLFGDVGQVEEYGGLGLSFLTRKHWLNMPY